MTIRLPHDDPDHWRFLLDRFRRDLRRGRLLVVLCFTGCVLYLAVGGIAARRTVACYLEVAEETIRPASAIPGVIRLLPAYLNTYLAVAFADLIVIIALVGVIWVAGLLIAFANEYLYSLFATDSQGIARQLRENAEKMRPTLMKVLGPVAAVLVASSAILILYGDVLHGGPEVMIARFVGATAIAIIIVTALGWWVAVRFTLGREGREFLPVLLSRQQMRRSFKAIVDMTVVLSLVGWLLLAPTVSAYERIAEFGASHLNRNHQYAQVWEEFIAPNLDAGREGTSSVPRLPPPESLAGSLFLLRDAGSFTQWSATFPLVMSSLFFVLTVYAACSIGVPSVFRVMLLRNGRAAAAALVLATVKSFIVVLGLQLFISRVYMVDITRPLGAGSVFFFAVSYFLMEQTGEAAVTEWEVAAEQH